ncbi:acylphosphatase [bacterium]|nr:MAG: acylphosphatase [bacterium]
MENKRYHILVYGIVQGVGYRYFAYRVANELGISGFVRNLRDGSVEVMAQGDEQSLTEFVDKLRKGPISAMVTDIKITELPVDPTLKRFEIKF